MDNTRSVNPGVTYDWNEVLDAFGNLDYEIQVSVNGTYGLRSPTGVYKVCRVNGTRVSADDLRFILREQSINPDHFFEFGLSKVGVRQASNNAPPVVLDSNNVPQSTSAVAADQTPQANN